MLSEKELEVMSYAAEGYSSKEIAEKLCNSQYTIQFYINNTITKLKARSRTHAVVMLLRLGLIK